jgi:intracellular sulfur oxidation DsrE/DsrF family protein
MKSAALLILLLMAAVLAPQASAQEDDKPFAEARIVLQLADGDAASQERVLSVANNLIKHYGGPDFVDIEIVAYGPGLALLFTGNENEERIASLLANDVRFVGCLNTVESIERKTGTRPELIPETIFVQTGIAQLVQRAQQGFVVIRP